MEDDLKELKVEYPNRHKLDHIQILNLSLDKQTIVYKSLIKSKVEYISKYLLDHTKISYLDIDYQTIFYKS